MIDIIRGELMFSVVIAINYYLLIWVTIFIRKFFEKMAERHMYMIESTPRISHIILSAICIISISGACIFSVIIAIFPQFAENSNVFISVFIIFICITVSTIVICILSVISEHPTPLRIYLTYILAVAALGLFILLKCYPINKPIALKSGEG